MKRNGTAAFVTDSKSESVEKFYSETVKEYIEQKQQHFNYIPDRIAIKDESDEVEAGKDSGSDDVK